MPCNLTHTAARLEYVQDPGHGWLEVPLEDFPCALTYGTGFGHVSRTHAYLEEDCEMPAFLNDHPDVTYRSAYGSGHTYSRVRNLPRIGDNS